MVWFVPLFSTSLRVRHVRGIPLPSSVSYAVRYRAVPWVPSGTRHPRHADGLLFETESICLRVSGSLPAEPGQESSTYQSWSDSLVGFLYDFVYFLKGCESQTNYVYKFIYIVEFSTSTGLTCTSVRLTNTCPKHRHYLFRPNLNRSGVVCPESFT